MSSTALKRVLDVKKTMTDYFVERDDVINGMFTSLIARQNMLLLGPPGTAKSMLVKTFSDSMQNGKYFDYLVTKFTTPEELYGPTSLSGLKQDKYLRITTDKLPEAKVVFLDEIWKANSSILNSLLTAVNERIFFNDGPKKIPLEMLVGASNEYPQDSTLDALFDRFMLKYWVDYISDDTEFANILKLQNYSVATKITEEDLKELREIEVKWNDDVMGALLDVRRELIKEKFVFSDRRWVNAVSLVEAQAILDGKNEVERKDLLVLSDCMWNQHKDKTKVNTIIGKLVDPFGARINQLSDLIEEVVKNTPKMPSSKLKSDDRYHLVDALAETSQELETLMKKVKKLRKESGNNKQANALIDKISKQMEKVEEITVSVVRQ